MLTRRNFLQGIAASSALPANASAGDPTLREIPNSRVKIPPVGLGSWITFNVGNDPILLDACADVIATFVASGGGMIDSSPMYGSSQATIGYGLNKLSYPRSVFSTDKVWTSAPKNGPEQIKESKMAWGVERFDLLQVHNLVAWEEHLETLLAMKEDGRLAHVGVTTSHGRRHGLLEKVMRDYPLDFVQLTYNLADRDAEDRLLPIAKEKGISVIANRPFRRGALPRALQGKPLPAVAAELSVRTWPELLLKFIISHPAVTVAIPATTKVEHVRENMSAAQGPLPDPAMRQQIVSYFANL